jgi:CrcB protein
VTWLLVAAAGAAGAVSRYAVLLAIGPRPVPAATLLVNVAGSFLLGLVLPLGIFGRLSPQATAAITVGFLGAFTTFSAFSWELFDLGRTQRLPTAALYLAVSVAAGVIAAALGYRVGEALSR